MSRSCLTPCNYLLTNTLVFWLGGRWASSTLPLTDASAFVSVSSQHLIYPTCPPYPQYLIYLRLTTAVIIYPRKYPLQHTLHLIRLYSRLDLELPDYRVLYCKPCTAVVFPTSLPRHLQRYHNVLIDQRRLLVQHCQSLELIAKHKDLQLLADQSLALQFLFVHAGYSYHRGRFLTSSRSSIRDHINQDLIVSLRSK